MIQFQTIIDTVRLLATEQPEREAICQYVSVDMDTHQPRPECIVGHAFFLNGVDLETLNAWENHSATELLSNFTDHDTSDEAQRQLGYWCNRVQARQDNGDTWAEAVRVADDEFGFAS